MEAEKLALFDVVPLVKFALSPLVKEAVYAAEIRVPDPQARSATTGVLPLSSQVDSKPGTRRESRQQVGCGELV